MHIKRVLNSYPIGNVVWFDSASTARALVGLSKKIIGVNNRTRTDLSPKSNDSNDECIIEVDTEDKSEANDDKMDDNFTSEKEIHVKNINYPLPPGIWRKGIDCPKSKGIFIRFATRSDKKQHHAEKMSEYYKKYGNPNFGGMINIILVNFWPQDLAISNISYCVYLLKKKKTPFLQDERENVRKK